MGIVALLAEIIRDLLIFVGVMSVLLVVLLIAVARLPDGNPLKKLLVALCYRVGATVAAGAIAIPVEPIPGLDAIYDVGVPILLIIYWISFFRNMHALTTQTTPSPAARQP